MSAFGVRADITLGSRRLAQNINGSCRQYKRRHGDECDERRSTADDFAVVIELGPEEHDTALLCRTARF